MSNANAAPRNYKILVLVLLGFDLCLLQFRQLFKITSKTDCIPKAPIATESNNASSYKHESKKEEHTLITTESSTSTTKTNYILYGATSGWSNQVKSLEHAYWIAYNTNRTLILPPMLYHGDTIQRTFYRNTIDQVYNQLLDNPKNYRIKMTKIVDFDYWGATVPVIDYETWRQETLGQNLSSVQLIRKVDDSINEETGPFNCENTRFTMNASRHGVTETAFTCQDHIGLNKKKHPSTYTYRDIATALSPYQKFQLWNFSFLYPNALFDLPSIPSNLFQLHHTLEFRTAVRNIKQQHWQDHSYASIHIRGGDGPFAKQNWTEVFPRMWKETSQQIVEYHSQHPAESSRYILLMVSDVQDLRNRDERGQNFPIWKALEIVFQERLWEDHQIQLEVISGTNYSKLAIELQRSTGSKEAGVYLDQLMAACANIGFVGSSEANSTFQERIRTMRNQAISPC